MSSEKKRYASWELPDEMWELLEPLLPVRNWWMGRPTEVDLHRIAAGIYFVLRTGIQWNALPREQFGPPSTVSTISSNGETPTYSESCGRKR